MRFWESRRQKIPALALFLLITAAPVAHAEGRTSDLGFQSGGELGYGFMKSDATYDSRASDSGSFYSMPVFRMCGHA